MRKNCLYERDFGWVQYSEETFVMLRRERLRIRMRMRRQDKCFCSGEERWQCDGVCDGCAFQKCLEVSIDSTIKCTDGLTDGIDKESAYVEKMYCEDILKRLDEIMPMAREIGMMRLQGKSDREIARVLGIDRMTMLRMLERAKAVLKVEL